MYYIGGAMELFNAVINEVNTDNYTATFIRGARSDVPKEAFLLLNQPPDKNSGSVPGLVLPQKGTSVLIAGDGNLFYVIGYPLRPEYIHNDILKLSGQGDMISMSPQGTQVGTDRQGNYIINVSEQLMMVFEKAASLLRTVVGSLNIRTMGGSLSSTWNSSTGRSLFSWTGYKRPLAPTIQDATASLRSYTKIELGGVEDSELTMRTTTFSAKGVIPDTLIVQTQGRQNDDTIKEENISVGPVKATATTFSKKLQFVLGKIVDTFSIKFFGSGIYKNEINITPSAATNYSSIENIEDGVVSKVITRQFNPTTKIVETVDKNNVKWEIVGNGYASIISFDATNGRVLFTVDKNASFDIVGPKTVNINSLAATNINVGSDATNEVKGKAFIHGNDVEVKGSTVEITGGTLTVKGTASVDMQGPFCGVTACFFNGSPHRGKMVSGT
jgi:hypothetical protein